MAEVTLLPAVDVCIVAIDAQTRHDRFRRFERCPEPTDRSPMPVFEVIHQLDAIELHWGVSDGN
jgi:hypothetical protein